MSQFNLVQLRRARGQLAIAAHGSAPCDGAGNMLDENPQALQQALRTALAQGPFRGRTAVAAMPSSLVRVMPLTYHTSPDVSRDQAIAGLMQERIGDALDDYVLDYLPVENRGNSRQNLALVALCRKELVLSYLDLLRRSGLQVETLEIGPIAIRRLVTEVQRHADGGNVLVVNTGRDKSYLTLVADGRLLSDEEVSFGENQVLEHAARVLDLESDSVLDTILNANLDPGRWQDDGDKDGDAMLAEVLRPSLAALVAEIRRALLFASSESSGGVRNEVYLMGALGRWPGAEAFLGELLQVPVRKMPNPFVAAGASPELMTPGRMHMPPELAIACGLALHGYEPAVTAALDSAA